MRKEQHPIESWPHREEVERWITALARVATRERDDRGLDETWSVTYEYGSLWANYSRLRVPVAGPHPDVADEAELFEVIDRWVAFELINRADQLIDRDREYIAWYRAQLPAQRALWEQAAERVFRDVEATTATRWEWELVLHEDEPDWPRRDPDDERQGVFVTAISSEMPEEPPRRPLLLPDLWLHDARGARVYLGEAADLDQAVNRLAGEVQELIIEELWRAWPRCPEHEHPLELDGPPATTWTCPTTGQAIAEVGELGARA
ncbi:MAG: hypothetical protein ACTHK4_05705 [Mycobacteriales bacterium]